MLKVFLDTSTLILWSILQELPITTLAALLEFGNPNSVTDAAVGALCARTAVRGAFLNVKINCGDCQDKDFVNDILTQGQSLVDKATDLEKEIMTITESKL